MEDMEHMFDHPFVNLAGASGVKPRWMRAWGTKILNESFHFFSKVVLKIHLVFAILCSNRCARICMYFFIQRSAGRPALHLKTTQRLAESILIFCVSPVPSLLGLLNSSTIPAFKLFRPILSTVSFQNVCAQFHPARRSIFAFWVQKHKKSIRILRVSALFLGDFILKIPVLWGYNPRPMGTKITRELTLRWHINN